jgi:hypothetical protein
MRGLIAGVLFGFAAAAAADDAVYRYVDADGVVHYTDRAPDKHARPIHLAPVSGSRPTKKTVFYSPEALRAAARFAVRVESPTPDQRVEAGRAPVVAAASVMPALVQGFHLVYQVDGHAVGSPVDALSVQLPVLEPGSHELLIVLLDGHGREVARSTPADFHIAGTKLASNAPK